MADNVICGVTNFEVKRVLRKADGKDTFFQTHEGYWVTGDPELVEFIQCVVKPLASAMGI